MTTRTNRAKSSSKSLPGQPRAITLALQGGGAHGAFTWGVLDRLLEEEGIEVEGVSGTSAGAINAALLAQGSSLGGSEGASKALAGFWQALATVSPFAPLGRSLLDRTTDNWNLDHSPGYVWMEAMLRMFSPSQLNPLHVNPLRDLLARHLDLEALSAANDPKLFVCATNVRTGRIRVFDRANVTVDAILASTCLPNVFPAVEIDGDPYWDGGYSGNPAIFPLIYGCASSDVVIVQINPIIREGVPRSAAEIMNRLNEITFNSSLMRELQAIGFVNRLIDEAALDVGKMPGLRSVRLHMIDAADEMKGLGVASKLNPDPEFLHHLHAIGRRRADAWLAENRAAIGVRSTFEPDRI